MAAQVRSGPSSTPIGDQYVGKSVGELRNMLSYELNIPAGAPATVSQNGGEPFPVQDSYIVKDGDLVEFVRTAGTKGC